MTSLLCKQFCGLQINIRINAIKQAAKCQQGIPSSTPYVVPVANKWGDAAVLNPPKVYKKIEFPERRKLKIMEKNPQYLRLWKSPKRLIDMRGPEPVHNFLIHKQYGIRALRGGNLRHGHFEMIRLGINRKMDENRMFAQWRIPAPWKPVTKKGQGHRMGGGKGAVDHYVTPIKAERILVEVAGYCEYPEVFPFLKIVAHNLPFPAEAVSQDIMEKQSEYEDHVTKDNINPFTFEYCLKNNMMGCRKWASPYDYLWHNKHR